MTRLRPGSSRRYTATAACSLLLWGVFAGSEAFAQPPSAEWVIVAPEVLARDEAVEAAVSDLREAFAGLGLNLVRTQPALPAGDENAIVVGAADRNPVTQSLIAAGSLPEAAISHPEGHAIRTLAGGPPRIVVVMGGSVAGDVHGLYWLWDRVRVAKCVPDINVDREPAFAIRAGDGNSPNAMRAGLRYSVNWAGTGDVNDLVPWKSDDLAAANARNRDEFKKLIDCAHALHMKFFALCDEISYHPSLLEEFQATPSPDDPALWQALQEKYRRLFRELPELDGVRIRTGEHSLVKPPYVPLDIMHEPQADDWPLEKRYRMFVMRMHDVVVGEFGKLYHHRTWTPEPDEQHSKADIYRQIFTDDVPARNLYLSPYITRADRWLYQPYNPTFSQTPHEMLVLLSTMDYHANATTPVFPIYPGEYFCEWMRSVFSDPACNVAGAQFGVPGAYGVPETLGWRTMDVTAYLVYRLAWDATADPLEVAKDFASIHFGPQAAQPIAEALMLSFNAYKHGLYIKPVAEKLEGNTLPQLRLTMFPVRGTPAIDGGKAHVQWMHDALYTPSAGAYAEALEELDRGLVMADRMRDLGRQAVPLIRNLTVSRPLVETLELTYRLIETNNRYVRAVYAFCAYREKRDDTARQHLVTALTELRRAVVAFRATPGFCYQLHGIEQLMSNAQQAIDNLDASEQRLDAAPTEAEITARIARCQDDHAAALAVHGSTARKILRWEGMVDGKEILRVKGSQVTIEHMLADPPNQRAAEFFGPLPVSPGTVLLKSIRSRDTGPVVLEQPSSANNFTASIYLFDPGIGYGHYEFELYFVDTPANELGITPIR